MLPTGLSIENAVPTDLADILLLLKKCDLVTEDISPDGTTNFLIVRDRTRNLIGIIGLDVCSEVGLLRSLAVVEEYRGQGIASILLKEIEEIAVKLKIHSIYLLTQTASNFFSNREYSIIDRKLVPQFIADSKQYSHYCPTSSICMSKKLVLSEQKLSPNFI